jgi:hypothetical protein
MVRNASGMYLECILNVSRMLNHYIRSIQEAFEKHTKCIASYNLYVYTLHS